MLDWTTGSRLLSSLVSHLQPGNLQPNHSSVDKTYHFALHTLLTIVLKIHLQDTFIYQKTINFGICKICGKLEVSYKKQYTFIIHMLLKHFKYILDTI